MFVCLFVLRNHLGGFCFRFCFRLAAQSGEPRPGLELLTGANRQGRPARRLASISRIWARARARAILTASQSWPLLVLCGKLACQAACDKPSLCERARPKRIINKRRRRQFCVAARARFELAVERRQAVWRRRSCTSSRAPKFNRRFARIMSCIELRSLCFSYTNSALLLLELQKRRGAPLRIGQFWPTNPARSSSGVVSPPLRRAFFDCRARRAL